MRSFSHPVHRPAVRQNGTWRLWLRLFAVPFVLSLIDMTVTLYYQPPAYWSGDRSHLVEANPLVWMALRLHPALLIPGCIGWYVLFFFLIFHPPAWIGLRCHVAWVGAHLIAIAGWLLRHHPHGLVLASLVSLITVSVAIWMFLPFCSQWNSRLPVVLPAVTDH